MKYCVVNFPSSSSFISLFRYLAYDDVFCWCLKCSLFGFLLFLFSFFTFGLRILRVFFILRALCPGLSCHEMRCL